MIKFIAGHMAKWHMAMAFWTQIVHLNFKENIENMCQRLQHIWA